MPGIAAAPVVVAVGVGAGPWTDEALRRAAGNAARSLAGTRRVAFALPTDVRRGPRRRRPGRAARRLLLRRLPRRLQVLPEVARAHRVTLAVPDAKDADSLAAVARAKAIAGAVNLARDLVNTPADRPAPGRARRGRRPTPSRACRSRSRSSTRRRWSPAGTAASSASAAARPNPPRLGRYAYRPEGAKAHLALVGKGITFDTGGISIKPAASMHEMKGDMGGAAAVIGAVSRSRGSACRSPSPATCARPRTCRAARAIKPGDVLHTYSGKTIEVLDTDAEGRLVLSDGLTRAQEDKPDVIIDIATLTGAAVIALGGRTTGIMANDDDLREAVHDAVEARGRADVADAAARGAARQLRQPRRRHRQHPAGRPPRGRHARRRRCSCASSSPTAQKWAHLDIAGPSYNASAPYNYTPKGGTGASVRTLVQVAEDMANDAL